METYLEWFLLPLLVGLTLILVWFAAKTAWEQTRITMDKENKAIRSKVYNQPSKNEKINDGLMPTERKEILENSGFADKKTTFIVAQPVRYGHFFGREEIIGNLFNLWRGYPIQNAAIYGEKRIGKTSLLQYLKDVVDNPNNSRFREGQKTDWLANSEQYCFIYVDFQDVEFHNPKRLLEYILRNMKLEKADGLNLILSEENPLLDFGRILSNHLVRQTVILMDEIGVVLERHSDKFDNNFWEGLRAIATTKLEPQCLGFVLASHQQISKLAKDSDNSSPFFNIFGYIEELKIFTESEAKELISSSPKKFSSDDVEFILKKSELKPYLLQLLCQKCLARQNADNSDWQDEAERYLSNIGVRDFLSN